LNFAGISKGQSDSRPRPRFPFTISGAPIARDAALAEAGLDLALNSHATIGVSYVGQIASNVQDHAAKGRFSWKF
jgi:subtilase-type serine protease